MTTVPAVNPRASVPGIPVPDMNFDGPVPAGAFEFYARGDVATAGILFGCPCGCGEMQGVHIVPVNPGRPSWGWDGNRDSPTLTPSILIYQTNDRGERVGEHWHGFLTAGEFRSC